MASGEQPPVYTYLVVSREPRPERVVVWDTARIRIGRHHEQDIVLEDPEVSRQHALLRRDGERFLVEDLGTSNGTFVNGDRIRSVELHPNDAIRIGESTFRFCQSSDDPAVTLTNVTLASRLRRFQPPSEDARGSTMLGLPPDDDGMWNVGSPSSGHPTPPPVVRDLDDELGLPEKDDLPDFGAPDDPDPLMASAFDLGQPLPPVGQAPAQVPGAPRSGEQSASTVPTYAAVAQGGCSIELTLQLDGVAPELLRALQALLGQRFDLRALSVFLKALSIR